LAGTTEKSKLSAGILAAGLTLIAGVAGHGRLDDHRLANLDGSDRPANLDHRCGAFVADTERILNNL